MNKVQIPVKYIDTNAYIATVSQDECPEDPLSWTTPEERGAWFVLKHRSYTLPCEIDVDFDAYDSWEAVAQAVSGDKPYKYVGWYEHSGVVVRLLDDANYNGWDAGVVGVIVGDTTKDIENSFADWKHYIEGEVYGVTIRTTTGREVDSLWGLYGDDAVDQYIAEICGNSESETIKEWED